MLLVGALRSSSRSKRPTVGKFKKKKSFLGFLQLDERRMTTCRRYVMRKVFMAQEFFRKHATFTSWWFFCCFFWPNPILHILLFSKGLYKLKISQISQISQFFKWDLNLFFLSHKFYLRGGRIRRKQKSVNIVATKRMIMDNGGKANRIIWIYCFCTDSKSICADLSFGNQDKI